MSCFLVEEFKEAIFEAERDLLETWKAVLGHTHAVNSEGMERDKLTVCSKIILKCIPQNPQFPHLPTVPGASGQGVFPERTSRHGEEDKHQGPASLSDGQRTADVGVSCFIFQTNLFKNLFQPACSSRYRLDLYQNHSRIFCEKPEEIPPKRVVGCEQILFLNSLKISL